MNDTITRPIMVPVDINDTTIVLSTTTEDYLYIRQLFLIADGGDNVLYINVTDGVTTDTLSIIPLKDDTGFTLENTAPDYPFLFDVKPGFSLEFELQNATSVKGHIIYGLRK